MNKFKLAIGVILVFLVGIFAGSLGTGIYFKQRISRITSGGPQVQVRAGMVMNRLSNKLNLTDAQRIEVEKIVQDSQQKIFALRRKVLPEMEEITEQSFLLIKNKLNNAQNEKLDALYKKIKGVQDKFAVELILFEKTAEDNFMEIEKRVKLTREQEEKIRKILQMHSKKRNKIIDSFKGQDHSDISSLRHKIRELEISIEERLAEVFTENQMEIYRRIKKEERFKMRQERHP